MTGRTRGRPRTRPPVRRVTLEIEKALLSEVEARRDAPLRATVEEGLRLWLSRQKRPRSKRELANTWSGVAITLMEFLDAALEKLPDETQALRLQPHERTFVAGVRKRAELLASHMAKLEREISSTVGDRPPV